MRILISVIVLLMISGPASARPWFIIMDVNDPNNQPAKYGYTIHATEKGENVDFDISLDDKASKALEKASLFFHTPLTPEDPDPKVQIVIETKKGLKRIRFSIAQKLLSKCILQVDSFPIVLKDSLIDFAGCRLRIDNINYHTRGRWQDGRGWHNWNYRGYRR